MSVAASDIIVYASLSAPVADTGTNGGAIDPKTRIAFTQLAAADDIEIISTSASDTQNATVVGRDAAGAIVTQGPTPLTGVTAKNFATVLERVLSVTLSSDAVGTITVRRAPVGATIAVIPPGERGFISLFQRCASDPSVTKTYYSKVFVKNAHATLSLLSAIIKQNADPDARVTHLPANFVNDTATAADRVTAPSAANTLDPDTFDDSDKSIGDLAATAAWGVWMRLQLPAGDAAHKTTYTLEVDGQST